MSLKDKYCTISEAAKELGVTRQTIYRWIKGGKITVERIGRETLIERAKLNILQQSEFHRFFGTAMIIALRQYIRNTYGYTEDDIIEKASGLDFNVRRHDGSHEKIKVGGADIRISPSGKGGIVQVDLEKVVIQKPREKKEDRK